MVPRVFRVRQIFDCPRIQNVADEVQRQLTALELSRQIRPGHRVAVAVGSRGIANLVVLVRAIVDHLRQLGAEPFLVPAMGSHGGGTAEGQQKLLESYGLTFSAVGCPILSSLETLVVGHAAQGFPIHFDRLAFESNHVVVLNRIKPHTGFCGPIESGLMKMLLIGLGKCEGAAIYHRAIQTHSFTEIIRGAAAEVLRCCPIRAGLAVIENAYDQTAKIEAVRSEDFESREPQLLALAKQWMPRLPFREVDLLLIDRIGKDLSGTGLDPNVVGRKFNDHQAAADEWPKVRRIAVRGLTEATHGNALGLGMTEFCRSSVLRETDFAATRLNALVSGHLSAAMIPLDYENDRDMLTTALGTIGLVKPPNAKFVWIADTLHLGEVECSEIYWAEARRREDLDILTPPRELSFDTSGNLPVFADMV
ncbi:MAG: lactate racemase domain-containing protein [Planctomycetaceae bacterium]|nr:lactate racemase domain-containing protein [Planctomycetaceae bacterium]